MSNISECLEIEGWQKIMQRVKLLESGNLNGFQNEDIVITGVKLKTLKKLNLFETCKFKWGSE